MSKEEATILWRVLETLPLPYRDPLVLFYRSGDSTAEVADALQLSEEAVRQRLSLARLAFSRPDTAGRIALRRKRKAAGGSASGPRSRVTLTAGVGARW